ncbi:DNA/RNA non-specific endonuclease [Hymenobacter sp. H14-R3]|uniref:DNA/RNA non-specific endonuclease n=1 Tax=Hymenobacter sp. H14-R3 TaxID=3046308 RepID=UPI0024B9A10E|nr:DNA/RNA non-specific endonuclease [Hymenobacter sp. H14-R3]MDJ0365005.1 DNA/RNA non-specific endonuclease [Hymenobacter sp. H14-R3]
MKFLTIRLAGSALLLAFITACSTTQDPAPAPDGSTRDDNLALGNPSGAVADATGSPTNYLLTKAQYALSYNRDQGKPNWVSWHLSNAWLGAAPRQDNFAADDELPGSWYQVSSSSYTSSGFDRGHNCPSADRTGSAADNTATFLMTNMMPQAPQNNQRTWAGLENYCRSLVGDGNELYLIAGSYGRGGTGSNGYAGTLDGGRVTVPSRCWKVVVVLPIGTNDVGRITASTRVIAIDTPNNDSVDPDWGGYRTTVNAIETATGYDLLSAVSTTIQRSIEARKDTGPTN